MQREWSIVEEGTGNELCKIIGDTGMGGASLTFFGTWHNPELLERYNAVFLDVAAWLRANVGAP